MKSPQPLAQMKVHWHYTSKRGALFVSLDGREDNAKWIPGSQCSAHHVNRKTLILTMPEWLAVKKGLMSTGRLTFGGNHDKFRDKNSGADEH